MEALPAVTQEMVDTFAAGTIEEKLQQIYLLQLSLIEYVRDLEKKAETMGSPEGLSKMMEGFMGNMMKF